MGKRRTLAQIKADPRVVEVWTEEDGCWPDINRGVAYWATLAAPYRWEGCSTLHEPSVARLSEALDNVEPEADDAQP